MIVSFSWDFYEYNNIQGWLSLVIENAIRKFCTMFTLWSVWLFFFCGQLFVVYHNKIAKELEKLVSIHGIQDNVRAKEKIWSLLNHFRTICHAKRQLFSSFQFMLMVNLCLSVVNILTCLYYTIENISLIRWFGTLWDFSDSLEFTFRLWLICHTADRIRSSVPI